MRFQCEEQRRHDERAQSDNRRNPRGDPEARVGWWWLFDATRGNVQTRRYRLGGPGTCGGAVRWSRRWFDRIFPIPARRRPTEGRPYIDIAVSPRFVLAHSHCGPCLGGISRICQSAVACRELSLVDRGEALEKSSRFPAGTRHISSRVALDGGNPFLG